MSGNSITLREARPTREEGLACGRYLDEAAEGFFRFMLGRRAVEIIAAAYSHPNHQYSFENVTFAEQGRRIVGMALGFTAEQHRGFSDRPLKEAAGYPTLRLTAVRILCAPLMRILNTLADGDYYLLAMAVDSELRGRGIGSTLIESSEARGIAGGSVRLVLDVATKNAGARRLYERHGMTIESQWPRRLKMPGLKLYRMTKSL